LELNFAGHWPSRTGISDQLREEWSEEQEKLKLKWSD